MAGHVVEQAEVGRRHRVAGGIADHGVLYRRGPLELSTGVAGAIATFLIGLSLSMATWNSGPTRPGATCISQRLKREQKVAGSARRFLAARVANLAERHLSSAPPGGTGNTPRSLNRPVPIHSKSAGQSRFLRTIFGSAAHAAGLVGGQLRRGTPCRPDQQRELIDRPVARQRETRMPLSTGRLPVFTNDWATCTRATCSASFTLTSNSLIL